jgi:hypothetical protein
MILIIVAVVYIRNIHIPPPDIKDTTCIQWQRTQVNDSLYFVGNNWLHRSPGGLWEVYLEGNAFERGVAFGKLTRELLEYQEDAFVEMINQYVPSPSYLNFLRYFVAFFNRNLPEYIPEEYQQEIYGVSLSTSSRFDFIAPAYLRQLNYHAAHDIGHALQNMNLVGCTSFALWDNRTQDNQLLIGRNFDFHAGERFAENKLLCFVNPDTGYPFVMIGWAGMCGVLSGMNEKGLTVTINAAKSGIPTSSAMPVSLLAREILQYASTIQEAQRIAGKRQVFVSESFLIGSLSDNKAAVIEKTPEKTALYTSSGNQIVCTNHFQGKAFADDAMNIENIRESDSPYRYARVRELLEGKSGVDEHLTASILRETRGLNDKHIGYGNEKSINQLIAHHSVIFHPSEKKFIVSTHPYQLGEMKAYRMDSIFTMTADRLLQAKDLSYAAENIPADTLLYSIDYAHFLQYRQMRDSLKAGISKKNEITVDESFRDRFISSNPEMYDVYHLLGDWYESREEPDQAVSYWKMALSKEIPRLREKENLEKKIQKHQNKVSIRP